MEIRDTRNGDWHWVYNALLADPHLTAGEKLVYSAISTFGGHQVIHPTKEQLSERCSLDEKTVQRAIKRLEEVGYLSTDKSTGRGNANVYYLLKKSKGCNLCPFEKGGQFDAKGGHLEPERGTETTPHIDSIDKKDISETHVSRVEEFITEEEENPKPKKVSGAKYPNAKTVFGIFAEVLGERPLSWDRNTNQLISAQSLYETKGLDGIENAVKWYRDLNHLDYCLDVSTPWDLDTKWGKFDKFVEKHS